MTIAGVILRRVLALLIDLGLVALATMLALILREDLGFSLARIGVIFPHMLLTMLFAAIALYVSGADRAIWRYSSTVDYLTVFAIAAFAVIAAMLTGFAMNRLQGVARSLPLLQFLLMMSLLGSVRFLTKCRYQARARRATLKFDPAKGAAPPEQRTVLIVGLNVLAELYLRCVTEFPASNIKIIGLLGREDRHTGRVVGGLPVLGTPEEVGAVVAQLGVHGVTVDRIVLSVGLDRMSPAAREALLAIERTSSTRLEFLAERLGLDGSNDAATQIEEAGARRDAKFEVLWPLALADDERAAIRTRAIWSIKRAVDFLVAGALLAAGAPLIILVALIVAIDLGLPTVFWQQRPGIGGRPFRLYKFRTMRSAHDRFGRRISDDDRGTVIGRLLRRYRLDELPQLYNILVGDMSFIGPRPLLPVDQPSGNNPRLLVRPGLTGWAQVNGGRDISIGDKTALDVWYLRHATLWLEARIVLRTLDMVMNGERRDDRAIRRAYSELNLPRGAGSFDRNGLAGEAAAQRFAPHCTWMTEKLR